MRLASLLVVAALVFGPAACSKRGPAFLAYHGPEVTHVVVQKSVRKMYLLHHDEILKEYDVGLGFNPDGHKLVEGDGRTPEGTYLIDRRNPRSEFHLSVGISYPNEVDVARALENGSSPGGDIFIHGKPRKYRNAPQDWTAGCIAVTNREIEQVYAMVQDGTPITINP